MAINPQYGMGTYNARLPTSNVILPRAASGIASPLAFFPSLQSSTIEEALDTSLQDLMETTSTARQLTESAVAQDSGGTSETSSTGEVGNTSTGGFGLSPGVASAVGKGASTMASLAGLPGLAAAAVGSVASSVAGKGVSAQSIGNTAINVALTAMGLPGLAISALSVFGWNPMQAIEEALGVVDVTPGFEGGAFGQQGIGGGITGGLGGFGETSGYGESPGGYGFGESMSGTVGVGAENAAADSLGTGIGGISGIGIGGSTAEAAVGGINGIGGPATDTGDTSAGSGMSGMGDSSQGGGPDGPSGGNDAGDGSW